MVEQIMFFSGGFLVALLLALILMPVVHRRAVRLTSRRLEDSVPRSVDEIRAQMDGMRAGFAMSTRRLERRLEYLKVTDVNRLVEIGRLQAELAKFSPRTMDLRKVESPRLDVHEAEYAAPVMPDTASQSLPADDMDHGDWRRFDAGRRSAETLEASTMKLEEEGARSVVDPPESLTEREPLLNGYDAEVSAVFAKIVAGLSDSGRKVANSGHGRKVASP